MAVTAACQRFIDEVLKPRFLPVIRPTQFNYPIDIHGKWRGTRYRFIQRYRSGFPETLNEEFDSPFAALDWVARDRFDIQWYRHTGAWHCLYRGLSLTEALNGESSRDACRATDQFPIGSQSQNRTRH